MGADHWHSSCSVKFGMKLTFRRHEVKSLKQLEVLVTENAEAIEPGCRIVAAGVNLGRSTVDLAGVDARQTPMLVALGFTADDEMLFSMLEAYAWCLEYPESVRGEPVTVPAPGQDATSESEAPGWLERLASLLEPSAATPAPEAAAAPVALPRPAPEPVEASAEPGPRPGDVLRSVELPASRELGPTWRKFLEKLTSGFDVLAAPPVPDAPPAPAPEREPVSPALAPVTRSGRHGGSNGDRHALLDGVRLPPNGELVPQWRKFLDKQSIDEGKIEAVKEYLHREFPLCTVYDFFEFERGAHVFQLQDNQGKVTQLA